MSSVLEGGKSWCFPTLRRGVREVSQAHRHPKATGSSRGAGDGQRAEYRLSDRWINSIRPRSARPRRAPTKEP